MEFWKIWSIRLGERTRAYSYICVCVCIELCCAVSAVWKIVCGPSTTTRSKQIHIENAGGFCESSTTWTSKRRVESEAVYMRLMCASGKCFLLQRLDSVYSIWGLEHGTLCMLMHMFVPYVVYVHEHERVQSMHCASTPPIDLWVWMRAQEHWTSCPLWQAIWQVYKIL